MQCLEFWQHWYVVDTLVKKTPGTDFESVQQSAVLVGTTSGCSHSVLGGQNQRSETRERLGQLQEGMLKTTAGLINEQVHTSHAIILKSLEFVANWFTCKSSLLPPLFSTSISRQRLRKSRKMGDNFQDFATLESHCGNQVECLRRKEFGSLVFCNRHSANFWRSNDTNVPAVDSRWGMAVLLPPSR